LTVFEAAFKGRKPLEGESPEIPLRTPLRQLLEDCWHADPKKRPAMKVVLKKVCMYPHASVIT
jgi:hypothetical protein